LGFDSGNESNSNEQTVQFEVKITLAMNSKLLLCLALGLSGGLLGCSNGVNRSAATVRANHSQSEKQIAKLLKPGITDNKP
jgi:hypothetical protein